MNAEDQFYAVQRQVVEESQWAPSAARRPKGRFPKGWEPYVQVGDVAGVAVSAPLEQSADERMLIEGWKLDPEEWEVQPGTLLVNRWQQKPDEDSWLYQYKAKLQRRAAVDRV